MDTSDRSRKKRELDLFPYLARCKDLFVDHKAAGILGFKPEAFAEVLAAGIGPEPHPAFAAGKFWFEKWQLVSYWGWLQRGASDEDRKAIADSIRRHDTIGEFKHLYGLEPREMVNTALWEWRGCQTYSKVLRMHLEG